MALNSSRRIVLRALILSAAISCFNIIHISFVISKPSSDSKQLDIPAHVVRAIGDEPPRNEFKLAKNTTAEANPSDYSTISKNETKMNLIYLPTTFNTDNTSRHRSSVPTFLFGIPSYSNAHQRRQLIRETYLSCYKDTSTPNRICSLGNYTPDCQVAYSFFIGGNPLGPTELLEPNQTFPLTLPSSESDVVVLNIQENQMKGKMPTWFKFASAFRQFDYIAKIDDDSIVLVPNFLSFMEQNLPAVPRRIYGGLAMDKYSCDPAAPDGHSHPCPLPLVGEIYMSGELNFMSRDLAIDFTNTTTLPQNHRSAVKVPEHEDVSMSNYVFAVAGGHIQIMSVPYNRVLLKDRLNVENNFVPRPFSSALWGHSVTSRGGFFKDLGNFRDFWLQFTSSWKAGFRDEAPRDLYKLSNSPDWDATQGLVHARDYIYRKIPSEEDASPVVVQRFRLVFFVVHGAGDETWRELLLRMQLDSNEAMDGGLRRLFDFDLAQAGEIMSTYTIAMMVRNPTERLAVLFRRLYPAHKKWLREKCGVGSRHFADFLNLTRHCSHVAWRPQGQRMEPKFNLNRVLRYDDDLKEQDAEALLKHIGAWDLYGTHPLFPKEKILVKRRTKKEIELPAVRHILQEVYGCDYLNPNFNFFVPFPPNDLYGDSMQ